MKDSEFIELLNLYLDHEISAADAARLESEVQSNPSRRRIYQDYCRMQKACKVLAQDFATETPTSDGKIVAFEQAAAVRARRARNYYASALAAAAACVAAVFIVRHGSSTPGQSPTANFAQTTAPAPKSATAAAPMVATTKVPPTESSNNAFSLRRNAQEEALALAVRQTDPQFAWLQNVRLEPVQLPVSATQLRFDTTPTLRPDNRTYNGPGQLPADVYPAAIRFQK